MRGKLRRFRRMSREVLGINARNLSVVYPDNPRHAFRTVDDKLLAKEALARAGVPVPDTLFVVERFRQLRDLRSLLDTLPGFVVKPATASGGAGVLVVARDESGRLVRASSAGDRLISADDVLEHAAQLLAGLASPARMHERAFLEQLLEPDEVLGALAYRGLPDVRVLVHRGRAVMAMARVPTRRSGGRANLHQGALGFGIDLVSGRTTQVIRGNRSVSVQPDTNRPLAPVTVPHWDRILELAVRAAGCFELGYLGVDLIVDRRAGPLVIELNARPGLNIQLANAAGLRKPLGLPI